MTVKLTDIQRETNLAAGRAQTAETIMDQVVVENGDPNDAQLAIDNARAHLKEADRLIQKWRPATDPAA